MAANSVFRQKFIASSRKTVLGSVLQYATSERLLPSPSSRLDAQKHTEETLLPGSGFPQALGALALQFGQGFLIHIPFLQDGKDGLGPKPAPRQLPENARRRLLILGFH